MHTAAICGAKCARLACAADRPREPRESPHLSEGTYMPPARTSSGLRLHVWLARGLAPGLRMQQDADRIKKDDNTERCNQRKIGLKGELVS
jgi:hypothetical protein